MSSLYSSFKGLSLWHVDFEQTVLFSAQCKSNMTPAPAGVGLLPQQLSHQFLEVAVLLSKVSDISVISLHRGSGVQSPGNCVLDIL